MIARVLVVDDDTAVRYTLAKIFEREGASVRKAQGGEEALAELAKEPADLVVTDLRMQPMDGLELLKHVRQLYPSTKVVVVTAHGSERHAVEAMKLGAWDYFRKPFEVDELVAASTRALESVRLSLENERLSSERNLSESLVFRSQAMGRVALLVQRVAPRDVTVLITGESGTGKERVAEAIVRASGRADKPFIRFNCAALTTSLAEAELFGHTKGAFTGAEKARSGLFREANGGTLLLDEIGELDLTLQAKLLRVLQQGEVRPVGDDRAASVNVRILSATHRNLPELVRSGSFREDLYYRLKVVELAIPPLRERTEDIPALVRHFLHRYTERFGTGPLSLTAEILALLTSYSWPGNVRELENSIEALVALSEGGTLDPALVPRTTGGGPQAEAPALERGLTLKQRVDAYERGLIVAALEASGGNRKEAAQLLGLSRATLHDKLHRHGLTRGDDTDE